MKRRYIAPGTKLKLFPLRVTEQEMEVLRGLAKNAGKSMAGYVRDKVFPRGGFDLFAASHPLTRDGSRK